MTDVVIAVRYVLALMIFSWIVGLLFGVQWTWWKRSTRVTIFLAAVLTMAALTIVETWT